MIARGGDADHDGDALAPGTAAAAVAAAMRGPAPTPRAWTVDANRASGFEAGLAPAADQATRTIETPVAPARARQAWRDAVGLPEEQEIVSELSPAAAILDPLPTNFADHFLRELAEDVASLRRTPDRNRLLPSRTEAAEPPAEPPAETPVESAAPRLSSASSAPRRITLAAGATDPLGTQQPLAGTPVERTVEPAAEPAVEPVAATLPGMSAATPADPAPTTTAAKTPAKPRPKRAPKQARPVAAQPVAEPASEPGAPVREMIGDLVDQCVRLTSGTDAASTPTKIALAVTLPDGTVMKVSVKRPQADRGETH